MPPIDPKKEALRFKRAKDVIREMKKRRTRGTANPAALSFKCKTESKPVTQAENDPLPFSSPEPVSVPAKKMRPIREVSKKKDIIVECPEDSASTRYHVPPKLGKKLKTSQRNSQYGYHSASSLTRETVGKVESRKVTEGRGDAPSSTYAAVESTSLNSKAGRNQKLNKQKSKSSSDQESSAISPLTNGSPHSQSFPIIKVIDEHNQEISSLLFSPPSLHNHSPAKEVDPSEPSCSHSLSYSPFIRASGVRKCYGRQKNRGLESEASPTAFQTMAQLPSYTSEADSQSENRSFSRRTQKKIVKKGAKSRLLRKIIKEVVRKKLHCPPMSVKMDSGNVRRPVFHVTDLDDDPASDTKKSELLGFKVESDKSFQPSHTSSFQVTSVPFISLSDEECDALTGSDLDEEGTVGHKTLAVSDESAFVTADDCDQGSEREDGEDTSKLFDTHFEIAEAVGNNDGIKKALGHSGKSKSFVSSIEEGVVLVKEDENEEQSDRNGEFYFINGRVVLHLRHPGTFVFCGVLEVEVLKGAIEVLGFLLTPENGSRTVFSSREQALYPLKTVATSTDSSILSPQIDDSFKTLIQSGSDGDTFVLLRKAESPLPLFFEQYVNNEVFLCYGSQLHGKNKSKEMEASKKLECYVGIPRGSHIFNESKSWNTVSGKICKDGGCTVIAGGKGVGKSTMLRFLTNRLLSNGKEGVVLIDLDPGQSEMTPPGCVSISLVQEPLLGPNFTHLRSPLKCIFYGDINVSKSASRYMDACGAIINFLQTDEKLKQMPCLVNTMGFTKGLGITIMLEILSVLQPKSVIQICSSIDKLNYPSTLTPKYVNSNCSQSPFRLQLTEEHHLSCSSSLDYDIYIVSSLAVQSQANKGSWSLRSKQSRDLVLLSYACQVTCPPFYSLLGTSPYCCPLDSLYLCICHESVPASTTLSAFNANFVALCHVNPSKDDVIEATRYGLPSILTKPPISDCLGFGIVRGIDMETLKLYLLTPMPSDILAAVNCLVLGAVCLPSCIYTLAPKESGAVPYVASVKYDTGATY